MSGDVAERQEIVAPVEPWPVMAFSEAVAINPKRPLPKSGDVPFLDMAALPLNGAPVSIVDKRPVASGGARFQAGDTLFARITPCAENGKLGFVSAVAGDTTAQGSTEFVVMGARNGLTLPEYVRWLSGWGFVRENAIGLMEGTSGRQRIPAWAFDEIEVPVPPLDEQRRIAEVLRSVDEAIAAAEVVATSMLRASKAMRHELLNVAPDGTVSDLPPDWTILPLEALASVERGKFSIRPRNDPRYFGGSTPFIQTGDVTAAGDYITRHTQTLNDLGVGVSRVFPAGTIMTTIAANIGDFAIASYPVACPDSVVGIEANAEVNPFWLYSVLTCFKAARPSRNAERAEKHQPPDPASSATACAATIPNDRTGRNLGGCG